MRMAKRNFDPYVDVKEGQFYRVHPASTSCLGGRPRMMVQPVHTNRERERLLAKLQKLSLHGLTALGPRQLRANQLYLVRLSANKTKYAFRRMVLLRPDANGQSKFRDLDVNGCDYSYVRRGVAANSDDKALVSQVFEFPETDDYFVRCKYSTGAYVYECAIDKDFYGSTAETEWDNLTWAELIIHIVRMPQSTEVVMDYEDLPRIKWFRKHPQPDNTTVVNGSEPATAVSGSQANETNPTGFLLEGRFRAALQHISQRQRQPKAQNPDEDRRNRRLATQFFFMPDCRLRKRESITKRLSLFFESNEPQYMVDTKSKKYEGKGTMKAFFDEDDGRWKRIYILEASNSEPQCPVASVVMVDFGRLCLLPKRLIAMNIPTDLKEESHCALYCQLAHIKQNELKSSLTLHRLLATVEASDCVRVMIHKRRELKVDALLDDGTPKQKIKELEDYWRGFGNPILEPYLASVFYDNDDQLNSLEEVLVSDLLVEYDKSNPPSWCQPVPLLSAERIDRQPQLAPSTCSVVPSPATVALVDDPQDVWIHFGRNYDEVLHQLEQYYHVFPTNGLKSSPVKLRSAIEKFLPGYPVVAKVHIRESDEIPTFCRGEIVRWSESDVDYPEVKLTDYPLTVRPHKRDVYEMVASSMIQYYPKLSIRCQTRGWEKMKNFDAAKFSALFFHNKALELSSVSRAENRVSVVFCGALDLPDGPLYDVVLLNRENGGPLITDEVATEIGLARFGNISDLSSLPIPWHLPNNQVSHGRLVGAYSRDSVVFVRVQQQWDEHRLAEQSAEIENKESSNLECHPFLQTVFFDNKWCRAVVHAQERVELIDMDSTVALSDEQFALRRPLPLVCCAMPRLTTDVPLEGACGTYDPERAVDCLRWILSQQDKAGKANGNAAIVQIGPTGTAHVSVKFLWPEDQYSKPEQQRTMTIRPGSTEFVRVVEEHREFGDYYYVNQLLKCVCVPRLDDVVPVSMKPPQPRPIEQIDRRLGRVPVADDPLALAEPKYGCRLKGTMVVCHSPWFFFFRPLVWDQAELELQEEIDTSITKEDIEISAADQIKVGYDYLCKIDLNLNKRPKRVRVIDITKEPTGEHFDVVKLDSDPLVFSNVHYTQFYYLTSAMLHTPSLVLPCGELHIRPLLNGMAPTAYDSWLDLPIEATTAFTALESKVVELLFLRENRLNGVYPVSIECVWDEGAPLAPMHNRVRNTRNNAATPGVQVYKCELPDSEPTINSLPPEPPPLTTVFPAFVKRVVFEKGKDARPYCCLLPSAYAEKMKALENLICSNWPRFMEPMPKTDVTVGRLCLLYFEGYWRRAELMSVENSHCSLLLIDDGRQLSDIGVNQLFIGHTDLWNFRQFHPMIRKAYIYESSPVTWSTKLVEEMETKLVHFADTASADQSLTAALYKIVNTSPDGQYPTVVIHSPRSEQWIGCNELLSLPSQP